MIPFRVTAPICGENSEINSTAREKYDTEFEKIRTKALAMKKGLSEDSPRGEVYEFSEFLRVKEDELRELANKLIKG